LRNHCDGILSIDVEEWFHICEVSSVPDIFEWDKLEPRIVENFYTLLDCFDGSNTKVTLFFLGWVAERYPELVKTAHQRGH